jgi:hypothetical protein
MPSQTIQPDPRMIQKLRIYDKKLSAFLNVINDRWTIVRYVPMAKYGGTWGGMSLFQCIDVPWPILCVQEPNGGYMPLDERSIYLVWESDLQNIDNLDRHFDKLDDRMASYRRKMIEDFQDDIRYATLENKRQLMEAFEPFDRDNWQGLMPPKPMSHEPVKVSLDDITF